jgi:hypothetical protein
MASGCAVQLTLQAASEVSAGAQPRRFGCCRLGMTTGKGRTVSGACIAAMNLIATPNWIALMVC